MSRFRIPLWSTLSRRMSYNKKAPADILVLCDAKMFITDPGSEFFPIPVPDPGSRGQKSTGSWIRNTGTYVSGTTDLFYRII